MARKQLEVKEEGSKFYEPTENDKELIKFVINHTDRWRDYRNQNYLDDWERYERIWRGIWSEEDKTRGSERSRVISPATQQAVETSHAETMEAIFGQGEFFDIKDDLSDENKSAVDIESLKNQLNEDFKQDKIRKSFDQAGLMAKIYGTGICEVTIEKKKYYYPKEQRINEMQVAYGTQEKDRFCVKLNPVNPKNFLFDPNGTSVEDCMGVAIEKYISIHKVMEGISGGIYKKVDISTMYDSDDLEPTQQKTDFQDDKVVLLTYYGLVPKEYLKKEEDTEESDNADEFGEDVEDYEDMVEAIVVIANGGLLLKAEENPYMMKDRPVICWQDDTVPNRLLGRGIVEKAFNMQVSIDGSMRAHLDGLALTSAPMMGIDATRIPRGQKFQVKPGVNFMVNGNPSEILFPFKFGVSDGNSMQTSKEFERMLLMATGTIDSNGTVSPVARDSQGIDMATATMIKKYKRCLVNFQEDGLIPFIYKAAWRYMQYDPERYPSVDVKFIPTATLGIIAREYEQKQLAFMVQTLGAQSPLTPILMAGILKNSSLSEREAMVEQMKQMSQPDPAQQQSQTQQMQLQLQAATKKLEELQSKIDLNNAQTQKTIVDAQLEPERVRADVISSISTNLPNQKNGQDSAFQQRAAIAKLMLEEEDIRSNERIATAQMSAKQNRAS